MKIDYEITVSIAGMNHKQKQRVQNAFCGLGITWALAPHESVTSVVNALELASALTNTATDGKVLNKLMCIPFGGEPTHTYDQLMELAGMTEANAKLSDLSSDAMLKRFNSNQDEIVRLTLENNELVALVRANGFFILDTDRAARAAADEVKQVPVIHEPRHAFEGDWKPVDASSDNVKPLTTGDLRAGGWWMRSATVEDGRKLLAKGVPVCNRSLWDDGDEDVIGCASESEGVFRINKYYRFRDSKQIHRKGGDFYWGAPE